MPKSKAKPFSQTVQFFLDNLSEALIVLNADLRIVFFNKAAENTFGYRSDEVIGGPLDPLLPPHLVSTHRKHVREFASSQERMRDIARRASLTARRKDGTVFPVEIGISKFREGNQDFSAAILVDITERLRVEQALQDSEERYRSLVENLNDVIFGVDAKGNLTYISPVIERLLGYSAKEILGQNFRQVVHPDDLPELQKAWERVAAGQLGPSEYRVLDKGGHIHWVRTSSRPFFASGRLAGLTGTMTDITQRRLVEGALEQSERQMSALVGSLDDIVFEFDAQGTYLNVWASNERLLTRPRAELLGRRIVEILGEQEGRTFVDAIARVLRTGTPEDIEYSLQVIGGRRWFVARISPIANQGDSRRTASMLVRDITDRREAEEQLRVSERRLSEAQKLAKVGHWNNDLASNKLTWSEEAYRVFAVEPSESGVTFQTFIGRVHPDDREQVLAANQAAKVTGERFDIEYRILLPRGEVRYIHELGTSERDESGKVIRLYGTAQDITERKIAEQEIELRVEQLGTLYDAGLALNRVLDPRVQMDFLLNLAMRALRADHAEFFRFDSQDEHLHFQLGLDHTDITAPRVRSTSSRISEESSVIAWVAEHRMHVNVPDVSADSRWASTDPEIRSALFAVVQHEKKLRGVLCVMSKHLSAFSLHDERLLVLFANQFSVALENARLFEETGQRLERLGALHAIDLAISSSFDPKVTLNVVLKEAIEKLKVDAAAVLLLKQHTNTLERSVDRGFRTREIERTRVRLGEEYAGRAAVDRRRIAVPDLGIAKLSATFTQLIRAEGLVSYFGMPLIARGQVKGVLEVFHRSRLNPDSEWLDFFEALARQSAIAIDNSELFDRLERSNAELSLAYDTTIEGWSRALDQRGRETEGHTQRVAETALRLAREMGIPEGEMAHVRRGALLHDIGNMGVPEEILHKPGPLTESEWALVRQHPALAFEFLSSIAYLRPALDIPYCHHEKWDGSGYPRGLKGDQIPLAARVFAVVDAWDVLRSDRPHRQAWTDVQAYEHLKEQAGKQFDPKVVEGFLSLIDPMAH
jgi:PAS domain S-box-containing protein